ncbi:hypothetical protein B0H10DRAFT_2222755 [Mycena sp. CBHHK59/15]|nr:hypothetical protein B0H10DRAFT_2222755 [Mycena sp. CBHHK59/15]
MPRLFFSSTSNDWISPLVRVCKDLASLGAVFQLIEMMAKNTEDLRYLAQSVVTIMKILREEIDSHPNAVQDPRFRHICIEFNTHLTRLSSDIQSMSKNWSSSRLKKYFKSNHIKEEIAQFTCRVNDLRANAILAASAGTRMDLADIANAVTAVHSRISDLQEEMRMPGTLPKVSKTKDVARFENDFHALKLGDIHLEFQTARTANFFRIDRQGRRTHVGWTDYKGCVQGSVRTIRVYQGSDPIEPWETFLTVLAENSPVPYLPQLFGFCASPRLRSLVFHGDFLTLDEYALLLPSPQAIFEWELRLKADFSALYFTTTITDPMQIREFALVNADDGKLVISHVNNDRRLFMPMQTGTPFMEWFMAFNPHSNARKLWPGDINFQLGGSLQKCVVLWNPW